MLVLLILPLTLTGVHANTAVTVSSNSPAIPVDTGEKVILSSYTYDDGTTKTPFSDMTWTSDDIAITDGSVTPLAKGIYKLTGTDGTTTVNVYVIAKEKDENEYVIFESDFSDLDVSACKVANGSYTLTDGKLTLNQNSVFFFPEYIGDFGNYNIDVIGTIKSANESTRWMSVMYRVKNNSYPYYQMCVRQGATATNGVEFAERTAANGWNVMNTASNTEAISPDTQYTFSISVYDKTVSESIDGDLLIYSEDASLHFKGRVGLQTNSCTAVYDSIKITLRQEVPDKPDSNCNFADTRDVASDLCTTPALVSYIDTADDLANILTSSPATALAYINSDGKIVTKDGTVLTDIAGYVKALSGTVIAGFIPDSKGAVDAINSYMKSGNFDDITVVSDDALLLKYANGKNLLMRTMLVFSEDYLNEKTILDMREAVNESGSKTALLPYSMSSKENVQALQKLLISVWVLAPEEETTVTVMSQILSGANGIVVSDRTEAEKCFTEYFKGNAFTRTVWIIGHRGIPALAPENSLEGCILAAEKGANIIENDIYITTDNVIVVMHDGSVDRTSDGTGNIESMTYAQLQEFNLDASGGYSGLKIPTLEEYFETFKDTDTFIFIEIKSGKAAIITELIRLVAKYDIADQISVISFNASQLTALNAKAPFISTGFLCSGVTSSANTNENIQAATSFTEKYNTTFNPSYSGITSEFITELQARGNTLWPWTFSTDTTLLMKYYLAGAHGLTTNNANQFTNTVQFVYSENNIYDYTVSLNDKIALNLKTKTYADVVGDLPNGKIVMVSGEDVISIEDNTITALKAGTASFFCSYQTTLCATRITVTSQLFTVTVEDSSAVSDTVSEEHSGDGGSLLWLWIAIGAVVVVAVAAVIIIGKRKKA